MIFPALLLALSVGTAAETAADLIARGNAALQRNHNAEALTLFQAAIHEAERAGDRAALARAYDRAAEAYGGMTDWTAMLDYSQRAMEADPAAAVGRRCAFFARRGRAFLELSERDRALEAFNEAFEHGRRTGDEKCLAQVETGLGLTYWRLDGHNFDKAIAYYDAAISRSRRINDDAQLIMALVSSGNLFRKPGTWPEAERRYGEGLEIARRQGTTHAFLLKNMGIVLRETGRRAQAERMLLQAVEAADRQAVGRIRWQGRMELGTFYRDVDPVRAARYYEECLDVLEAQHTNVLLDDYSAGALGGAISINDNPYDLYIDHLLERDNGAKALEVAERARARAFLDTLASARDALAARVPADFVREERALLHQISSEQSRLRSGNLSPADETRVNAAVQHNEERLAALRVRLAVEHPNIAHVRYPRAVSLAEVQRLVGPGEALLEYFLGAEASTLWVIRADRMSVVRLPPRRTIETAVREFVGALSSPDGNYQQHGRRLETMLVGSALAGLPDARRLIVIPNGVLHYLPFETLIDADGRFLIEGRAVSYAPSAASLSFLRSRPVPPPGEFFAIGNPATDAAGTAAERAATIDRVSRLKPLPFAARELDAAAATYRGAARVLQQHDATELALADPRLEQAAILHIATHGLIDEDSPQRSALALTMAAPHSDGILQMREIYQLRLRAALVTLSACQTALGKEVTGEGMVGFSRAFFYAGARAVMASLWNVNDASTADFMTRFYAALRDGESIDAAARSGKLAFIRSGGRLRHPYYWAAFVVTGDARAAVTVAVPRNLTLLAATAGGATALAAAAAIVAGLRRRRRDRPAPVAAG